MIVCRKLVAVQSHHDGCLPTKPYLDKDCSAQEQKYNTKVKINNGQIDLNHTKQIG